MDGQASNDFSIFYDLPRPILEAIEDKSTDFNHFQQCSPLSQSISVCQISSMYVENRDLQIEHRKTRRDSVRINRRIDVFKASL